MTRRQTAILGLLSLFVLGILVCGGWLVFNSSPQTATLVLSPTNRQVISLAPATAFSPPTFPPQWTLTPTPSPSLTTPPTTIPSLTPSATLLPSQTPWPSATRTPPPTPTLLWPSVVPATRPIVARPNPAPPTLDDFWTGRALWQLEIFNVGLPVGESDTLIGPDGFVWSYLHASYPSRGIYDQWGAPVPFPGCVTRWLSSDGGRSFRLAPAQCLIQCQGNPCASTTDHIEQQQYPRIAQSAAKTWVMVYEWGARVILRTSRDGLNWTRPSIIPGTGQWFTDPPCRAPALIGAHPFVDSATEYNCLVGGPPGIFIEGDTLYVFVGLGKNPGHMGCFMGEVRAGAGGLRPCSTNYLFAGSETYGPLEVIGAAANPHFDFRTITSADVLKVGDHYYMTYEGVRGPRSMAEGDTQYNLGFARSLGATIDGAWEKYAGNPVLMDVPGNVGIGHADLIVLDDVTYLYTATSDRTRGRYVLVWRP